MPGALAASFYDDAGMIGVGAIAFGTSPTRVFDRPTNLVAALRFELRQDHA